MASRAVKRPREAEKASRSQPAKKRQSPSTKPAKTSTAKAPAPARSSLKPVRPTRLKDALAELDRLQGLIPEVVEEVSSSSEDSREIDEYFKSLETEASPPSLQRTPISYGVQEKKERKSSCRCGPSRKREREGYCRGGSPAQSKYCCTCPCPCFNL